MDLVGDAVRVVPLARWAPEFQPMCRDTGRAESRTPFINLRSLCDGVLGDGIGSNRDDSARREIRSFAMPRREDGIWMAAHRRSFDRPDMAEFRFAYQLEPTTVAATFIHRAMAQERCREDIHTPRSRSTPASPSTGMKRPEGKTEESAEWDRRTLPKGPPYVAMPNPGDFHTVVGS